MRSMTRTSATLPCVTCLTDTLLSRDRQLDYDSWHQPPNFCLFLKIVRRWLLCILRGNLLYVQDWNVSGRIMKLVRVK